MGLLLLLLSGSFGYLSAGTQGVVSTNGASCDFCVAGCLPVSLRLYAGRISRVWNVSTQLHAKPSRSRKEPLPAALVLQSMNEPQVFHCALSGCTDV